MEGIRALAWVLEGTCSASNTFIKKKERMKLGKRQQVKPSKTEEIVKRRGRNL